MSTRSEELKSTPSKEFGIIGEVSAWFGNTSTGGNTKKSNRHTAWNLYCPRAVGG